eukprot:scaffold5317_cov160-Amphora_coffeaeformis.AAC.13
MNGGPSVAFFFLFKKRNRRQSGPIARTPTMHHRNTRAKDFVSLTMKSIGVVENVNDVMLQQPGIVPT